MSPTLVTVLSVAAIFAIVLLIVGVCTLLVWLLLWPIEHLAVAAGMHRMFLACRFLRAHMIVTWSIAGVAIGIMVMTIVTSVMSGFSREIRERIRGTQAHLIVKPIPPFKVLDYEPLVAEIRRLPHVVGAAPRIEHFGMLNAGRGNQVQISILAIDPEQERGWSEFEEYFRRGHKREFHFHYDGHEPNREALLRFGGSWSDSDEMRLAAGLGKQLRPGIVVGQELLKWPMRRGSSDEDARLFRMLDELSLPYTVFDRYVEIPIPTTRRVVISTVRPEAGNPFAVGEFEVVGHFYTGMSEYDSQYVLMDLRDAQRFLRMGSGERGWQVNTIAVQVDDPERSLERVRTAIEEVLDRRELLFRPLDYRRCPKCRRSAPARAFAPACPSCGRPVEGSRLPPAMGADTNLAVYTWKDVKAVLLQAVAMEKALQVIILFCIVIVAGFNILAIYTLMVRSKTRDVGILRSLGTGRFGIAGLFLWSGALCGFFGSAIGAALGLAVAYNLNPARDLLKRVFGIDPFPREIYYLDRIPADVDYRTIALIVGATILVGLIASVYPAARAARQDPIEAIRYE